MGATEILQDSRRTSKLAIESTTLRRATVRTDRRSLRTVDLAIVDGRGLASQLRYCTIVDGIFPPELVERYPELREFTVDQ